MLKESDHSKCEWSDCFLKTMFSLFYGLYVYFLETDRIYLAVLRFVYKKVNLIRIFSQPVTVVILNRTIKTVIGLLFLRFESPILER